MKIKKTQSLIFLFTAVLLVIQVSSARVGPTYAIVNCKIYPVSGPPVENGVIVIRDGLIESVGSQDKIPIPEDAEVIKAEGLFAYPGLIDAHSSFFIEVPREEPRARGVSGAAAQPQEKKENVRSQ